VFKKILLIIFIFLSFASLTFVVLNLNQTKTINSKATGFSTNSITLENSYLFASPLQAKADGKESIRLTIYLLDSRGVGIPNLPANVSVNSPVVITPVQLITDDSGKAVFDLSSSSPGSFLVAGRSANINLPQKVKITFY